jgi:hypothetical protein
MESLPSSDNRVSETPTQLDPTGKTIIKFRAWLDEGRFCSPNMVFLMFLQTGTMDKMKTVIDSECNVPSSESYRIVSSQTDMNIRAFNTAGSSLRSHVSFRQYVPWVLCNPRVHCYQTSCPEPVKFTPHLSTLFLWYILLLIPCLPSGLFVSVHATLSLHALLIYPASHLPSHSLPLLWLP